MSQFLTSIISLIASLTATILAFYVISQGLKDKIKRSYFLAAFSGGLWLMIYSIWLWETDHDKAIFLLRLVMVCAIFTYPTLLHFIFNLLNYKNRFITWSIYLSAFVLSIFCLFTNLFIKGVSQKLGYEFWPDRGGFIFDIYVLMWIIVIVISLYLLFTKYRKETNSVEKSRLRIVLIGMTIGYIGGATNFFLWYNIPIPPIGNFLIPIYFGIIAYAIIKHQLMDIKLVLRRSVVYSLSIVTIIAPATIIKLALKQDVTNWTNLIILVIGVSLFPQIRDYFYRIANKYFFSSLYDMKDVIRELNSKLKASLDLNIILASVSATIFKTFHTKGIAILICDKKNNQCYSRFSKGVPDSVLAKITKYNNVNILFQNYTKPIIVEEALQTKKITGTRREILQFLEKNKIEIVSPLHLKNKVVGYIFLGEKESGDAFNNEDKQVLEIVNTELAIAIENSLLYEATKQFNVTLSKQIAEATKKLRVQNVKLQQIDKIKTDFISTASHQLRTPLTATKWALDSLKKKKINKDAKENLDDLLSSNGKLIKLVNELLNISRIEEARVKIEPVPTDINELIKQQVRELMPLIKKQKLTVVEKYTKLPKIKLDPAIIQKATSNLLSNAIKYNRAGKKIHITIEKIKEFAKITVRDEGIGIPKQEREEMFKKFHRASNAVVSGIEGTGLGLYITKQAITMSGGTVEFESVEGKGSTFIIQLPLAGCKAVKGEKSLV
jgi:signal transduction histidine kinase